MISTSRLVAEIRAGILLLNDKGGKVTPEQADERARNIVQSLIVNYRIEELPHAAAVDWNDPTIVGKPVGHGWSCRCDTCADYHLKIKERV